MDVNGQKLLIEIFTPYYKIQDYGSVEAYIEQRNSHFSKYGFRTLFLNLDEDWDSLVEKVRIFSAKGR